MNPTPCRYIKAGLCNLRKSFLSRKKKKQCIGKVVMSTSYEGVVSWIQMGNSYLALEDTLKMILRKMMPSYWMAALFMFLLSPRQGSKTLN